MKKRCTNCFYRDKRFDEYPCLHCIADGNHPNWTNVKQQMIIEEFEKLKVEIHKLAFDDDGEYIGIIDNDDIMDLIDNYITRLKGE